MKTSRPVVIGNQLGLHARPAAEFVRRANSFRSDIWVVKTGRRYSAASLIDIMRANLGCGSEITLEAEGVDAEEAVGKLGEYLHNVRDPELAPPKGSARGM